MKIFFTLLILLNVFSLSAETIISGNVRSGKEIIPGANVFIKDSYDGTSSKADGTFRFSTDSEGEQTLVITCIGYEKQEKKVTLKGAEITIDFQLKELANELNTVTIVAGSFEAGADVKKAVILSSLDIATTAGAVADIYSAIQTLPGAQAATQEEGLFVRGGTAAETKTIFDGLWVQKPFMSDIPNVSQRGRFSPFMFKGTTFSAGGYSALYGQALSSVLILDSKDLPEKSTTDIGVMSLGGSIGHTHRFKQSSLNLNTSFYHLGPANRIVKQNIDWIDDPKGFSVGTTYRLKTSETGMLKFYSEYSDARAALYYDNLDLNNKGSLDNKDKTSYSNLTYQEYLNSSWKINAGLGYNIIDNKVVIDTNRFKKFDDLLQARLVFTGDINNKTQLKFGAESFFQHKNENYNSFERNFNEQLFAGFAETDYYFTHRFIGRLGLRAERSFLLQKNSFNPRASLSYKAGKYHQYSVAWGVFNQNPEDRYLIQSNNLNFEKASHYIVNYQFIKEQYIFRVEAYQKSYEQLITYDALNNISNDGSGYARGLDVFWRDRKNIKRGDYWISYSFLDTKRQFRDYPSSVRPPFAAMHTLNVVYKQYIPKITTQLGATYTFSSGRSYYNPNAAGFMTDKTQAYNNISFNASYLTSIKDHFTVVFISVGNLAGFKNNFGYEYSSNGSIRKALEPNALRTVFVGMFISIGDDNVLN